MIHVKGRRRGWPGEGGGLPYHGARVQPLDALHDLSLALLAAVLLPVDPGVSQLLHDLRGRKKGWAVRCYAELNSRRWPLFTYINMSHRSRFILDRCLFLEDNPTPGFRSALCGAPYLVQLCVDLVDPPLGTLHLLRQLLLHALLLIQRLSEDQ